MASVSHRGAISFAMVHIPAALYTATRENKVSFNQLDRRTHQRIRYKKVLDDGSEVPADQIVKGYEVAKGEYVIFEDDDFEKIKTEKDKAIHILYFTNRESVDPIYYEKSFYVVPEGGSDRAYELLRRAMIETDRIAIARTVMGTSETLIALLPTHNGMVAETLFYHEEIKPMPKTYTPGEVDPAQLEMAQAIIQSMDQQFDPAAHKDAYNQRIIEAIERKRAGQDIVSPAASDESNIISLMDALQRSLEKAQGDSGKKNTPRKRRTAAKR